MIAHGIDPMAVFLVQLTGSRKSSVSQTVLSVVTSSVTFIIKCTQSLELDQASKISQASTTTGAKVYAYQLDAYKTNLECIELADDNIHSIMTKKTFFHH